MKYMILTYASQQDYDGMAGNAGDTPAWSAEDFGAMGAIMPSLPQQRYLFARAARLADDG